MKGLHRIDLGQWPPALFITADKRAYNRFMREKQGVEFTKFPRARGGSTEFMKNKAGDCVVMIAIGPNNDGNELVATLAHEAVHAKQFILDYVGEKTPGIETEAYLVEHIVRRALELLRPGK